MKLKVIVINGSAESGKDLFVEYITESFTEHKIANLSTIDPSKEALLELGWDGKTKDEETRQAMVDLKQMSIRLFNGPFHYIVKKISGKLGTAPTSNWAFFVHCREPEEIQKLVDHFKEDCITLLVRNPKGKALKNGADDVVENYNYDFIIENDKTKKDLRRQAVLFGRVNLP